jgi:glutaredoxin 3
LLHRIRIALAWIGARFVVQGRMPRVKIYGTGTCPYCYRAKALLAQLNIPFEEVRIDLDKSALREFIEVTNGARTVPQILVDGVCIGGYTELSMLHRDGKLDVLTSR